MTLNELTTLANSLLTRSGSNRVSGDDIKTVMLSVISYFATQIADIIPDWTSGKTFNTDGTGDGSYCKSVDITGKKRLFETKVNGNLNHLPPNDPNITENTYWKEISASASAAIPEWAAGFYGPGLIIVYFDHPTDGKGLYLLTVAERPFSSANIVTEVAAAKWERIGGSSSSGGGAASDITFSPAGSISAVNVQAAIQELDTEKQASLGFTPENSANKGTASGYASLDGSGKVPASQLPAYVDDVIEVANFAALPGTGLTGIIYVTIDTNYEYRWSGSVYIRLVASPGSTDNVPEGSTNLYFTASRVLATILSGLSTATNAVITVSDSILSALGKLQKQITDLGTSKASLASPTFTGTPTAPTQSPNDNSLKLATTAYVDAKSGLNLTWVAEKTGAYNAAISEAIPTDCSSASVPITLPNAPADKATVAVKMVKVTGSNVTTVLCAGSDVFNKSAGSTTLTLSTVNQGYVLQYKQSSGIWYVVSDDRSVTSSSTVTANYSIQATDSNSIIYANPTSANITFTVDQLASKSTVGVLNIGSFNVLFSAGSGVIVTGLSSLSPGLTAYITWISATSVYITGGNIGTNGVSVLFRSTTTAGNATSVDTDIFTYTVPAGALSNNGESLEFFACGTTAANANNKTFHLRFGAGNLVFTTVTSSAKAWSIRGTVMRVDGTNQKLSGTLSIDGTTSQPLYTTTTETLTGTVVFRVTAVGVATNDIVGEMAKIKKDGF